MQEMNYFAARQTFIFTSPKYPCCWIKVDYSKSWYARARVEREREKKEVVPESIWRLMISAARSDMRLLNQYKRKRADMHVYICSAAQSIRVKEA